MAKAKRVRLNLDQMEAIILTGQKMSNVFYNIKQDERVPEDWRKWAEILQKEWDALKRG